MGTMNAVYVRKTDSDASEALLAKYRAAHTETDTDFFAVPQPDQQYQCPERQLLDLSAKLHTDVIWLSFQSTVDAFQFHHWCSGKHMRSIVYGCFERERTWERVEGDPEPWERQTFFNPRHLEIALKYAKDATERRELQRIYREAELSPGREEPSLDARECTWRVAEHFRFPGWGLAGGDVG